MILNLAFADSSVALDLRGMRVSALRPKAPGQAPDLRTLVSRALDNPLDGPPLTEICRRGSRITVVVPDLTRKADLSTVLPLVFERIQKANPQAEMVLLVACGTHPEPDADELAQHLGLLPDGVAVVNHDSRDPASLVPVGRLPSGVEVRLHRSAAEADVLVTIGAVRHHYFAGFGGGPKMIFPGVAGYQEIQANHALVLEREHGYRRHPRCEPGVLDGNPVACEIAAAADFRAPDLALCLVPDGEGRMAWAGAGGWRAAFPAAVEKCRSWYEMPQAKFRFMVASGGGRPYDSTLIQAHKALDAAARFLEDDGELLFVASMDLGAGSRDMETFLEHPQREAILERLSRSWVQYGHTTLRIVEKTSRIKVHLHSKLDDDLALRLGFRPTQNPESIVAEWREDHGGASVAVMAGTTVYPDPS